MFGIDELLSKKNQAKALAFMRTRREGHGPDGVLVSELDEYWEINGERILSDIRSMAYRPGIVRKYEIVDNGGKRRLIANMNVVDRLVERMLQQKLKRYLDPLFLEGSYAYREGRGAVDAAMRAREHIESGCGYVAQVDVKSFFASVELERAYVLLSENISDKAVLALAHSLMFREVEHEGKVTRIDRGLLQGSSISPIVSNLYLHSLDVSLDEEGFNWIRFADNIYVYAYTADDAACVYDKVIKLLAERFSLLPNKRKSGVFKSTDRRMLGYDFVEGDSGIEVVRHHYRPRRLHNIWHESSLRVENGLFHLVQDGIINQRDYGLLFENDEERHHIPPEVTDQINVYGNVSIAPAALRTISERGIRIVYFDAYGCAMGAYTPLTHSSSACAFLRQCELYGDEERRLEVSRAMQVAGIHNMRANLRYYQQRKSYQLESHIAALTECVEEAACCASQEDLLLIEARARKVYYSGFSIIVTGAGFGFAARTKRPPEDPCNALISFGNTVLYGEVLHSIWKTSLDPKIGIVHATNRRSFSLNLDFADIFKPVIVDRVVFSMVNRREIKADLHFREGESGGVLLNEGGKRLFLERLEAKLDSTLVHKGLRTTYRKLIAEEVGRFQRMLMGGERYRPYKYY